jgi:hypothetical protein
VRDNIFVEKTEGKRPLESSRHRWEENKMDLEEIGCDGVDCIHVSGCGLLAGSCEHRNEPSGSIKGEGSLY